VFILFWFFFFLFFWGVGFGVCGWKCFLYFWPAFVCFFFFLVVCFFRFGCFVGVFFFLGWGVGVLCLWLCVVEAVLLGLQATNFHLADQTFSPRRTGRSFGPS